ncbi:MULTISPECIES: hypothetical protein [Oscillatoriales]|nr:MULTISPECIES: hypothetical protein [Oscillatoriales]
MTISPIATTIERLSSMTALFYHLSRCWRSLTGYDICPIVEVS